MSTYLARHGTTSARSVPQLLRHNERRRSFVCNDRRAQNKVTRVEGQRHYRNRSSLTLTSTDPFYRPQCSASGSRRFKIHSRRYSGAASIDREVPWGWNTTKDDGIAREQKPARSKSIALESDDLYSLESKIDHKAVTQKAPIPDSFFTADVADVKSSLGRHPDALDILEPQQQSFRSEAAEARRRGKSNLRLVSALFNEQCNQVLEEWDKLVMDASAHETVTSTSFSAILKVLCSDEHIRSIMRQHEGMSKAHARAMRATPLKDIMEDFLRAVTRVARQRRMSGGRLALEDYANLLYASHTVGSQRSAEIYWRWLMADECTPDTRCYEHYLGAHVWNDTLPEYRLKRRVDSFYLLARDNPYAGPPFDNFKIGEDGIKKLVSRVFAQMLDNGVTTNEAIVCHVMVGMAREGDIAGMQKLMTKVWDINPSRILKGDDRSPNEMAGDSALLPTDKLLQTIAFCYCINGQMPACLRIIDYVSRHFGLTASESVWETLLHWSHVLSRPKRKDSTLEPRAVTMLWETMLGEPYNMQPTIEMTDCIVRAYKTLERPEELMASMDSGMDLFLAETEEHSIAQKDARERWSTLTPAEAEAKRKQLDQMSFKLNRHAMMLKQWVQYLLSISRESNSSEGESQQKDEVFGVVTIPQLLSGRWRRFVPRKVQYYTNTGHVSLWRLTDEDVLREQLAKQKLHVKRRSLLRKSPSKYAGGWLQGPYTTRRLEVTGVKSDGGDAGVGRDADANYPHAVND